MLTNSQFAQQRAAQVELEDHRRQVHELSQSRKKLQVEVANLKDKLEIEFMAKKEETGTHTDLVDLASMLIIS